MAVVKTDKNKWGYINPSGKYIIEAKYEQAQNFVNGEAVVVYKDETILINNRGKKLKEVENREEDERERQEQKFHK